MSSDDRIESTLAGFAAAVPSADGDLFAVIGRGQKYRNRALLLSVSLGVLAAVGAVVTTAVLVNALRSGPEPAQPAPVSTTTTSTTPPPTTAETSVVAPTTATSTTATTLGNETTTTGESTSTTTPATSTMAPVINDLPDEVVLLVAHGSGISTLDNREHKLLSGTSRARIASDLNGGVLYQPVAGNLVFQASPDGSGRTVLPDDGTDLELLAVLGPADEAALVYRTADQIRVRPLSGDADRLLVTVPAERDVWGFSYSGDTIGYISSDGRTIATSFIDTDGNPVAEPFDPEPVEPCHPFDDWCIGDMLLDPAGVELAYTWVLSGMEAETEVRIVDRLTGATSGVVVPNLVVLHDFHNGLGLASVSSDVADELVLIDFTSAAVTPIDLPDDWGPLRSARFAH